jgi:hypothetical protein
VKAETSPSALSNEKISLGAISTPFILEVARFTLKTLLGIE